jgi:signal transduction histidine kinase
MIFLDNWLTKLGKVSRGKIDPYSLQFRLILGLVGVLLLGLSSFAMWTGWEMDQFLIVTHQQKVEAMANRFLQDVERYSATLPMETGLQQAIDRSSSPDLSMWVKCADGKIMTESRAVTISPTDFQTVSMSLQQIPSKSQVYRVNGRQMVKYGGVLQVDSKTMGQLYIEQDMTDDHSRLIAVLQSLKIATLLVLVAITVVFSLFIWRSLLPLRQMSQWMRTHTAELNPYQLNLNQAPSEIKPLAKQWNRLSAHLSLHREHQRQFTNNIAHELRTPLSLVYGYLQRMLRRSDNLTTVQQEALSIAASETERTIQLLQNLIDLARADSGSMPFHLELLVLNDLIADVAKMVEKFGHRTIEIEAEPKPVKVKGDREAVIQVLTQLIDNAVKYSDAIEPITLKLSQTDDWAVIQVCDQGCGIALAEQSRIFELFHRVDPSRARSTGGVDLGCQLLNPWWKEWEVELQSSQRPGIGSTFSVTLPLANE